MQNTKANRSPQKLNKILFTNLFIFLFLTYISHFFSHLVEMTASEINYRMCSITNLISEHFFSGIRWVKRGLLANLSTVRIYRAVFTAAFFIADSTCIAECRVFFVVVDLKIARDTVDTSDMRDNVLACVFRKKEKKNNLSCISISSFFLFFNYCFS